MVKKKDSKKDLEIPIFFKPEYVSEDVEVDGDAEKNARLAEKNLRELIEADRERKARGDIIGPNEAFFLSQVRKKYSINKYKKKIK